MTIKCTIRVNLEDESTAEDSVRVQAVRAMLAKYDCSKSLGVYETNEDGLNPHVHVLFIAEAVSAAAPRQFFLRQLKDREPNGPGGNGVYSFKSIKNRTFDYGNMERYLCKGLGSQSPHVVASLTTADYTAERIAELHAGYLEYAKAKEQRENDQSRKATRERLMLRCQIRGITGRRGIALELVRMYKEEQRELSTYSLKPMVNLVWLTLSAPEDDAEGILADELSGGR